MATTGSWDVSSKTGDPTGLFQPGTTKSEWSVSQVLTFRGKVGVVVFLNRPVALLHVSLLLWYKMVDQPRHSSSIPDGGNQSVITNAPNWIYMWITCFKNLCLNSIFRPTLDFLVYPDICCNLASVKQIISQPLLQLCENVSWMTLYICRAFNKCSPVFAAPNIQKTWNTLTNH